ncbi:hypothetical protein [Mandarin fish ranavirus]|nr:hypothetical protein [Mandarin fish ranavirus]
MMRIFQEKYTSVKPFLIFLALSDHLRPDSRTCSSFSSDSTERGECIPTCLRCEASTSWRSPRSNNFYSQKSFRKSDTVCRTGLCLCWRT